MKLLAICSIVFLVACSNSEFTSAPECSIDGNKLTCNGETIEVKDGRQGDAGTDGLFVDVIDPCGPETTHDEVILVTRNGDHIAYFEVPNSFNNRLVVLREGINYVTTDGTNCRFRIENGALID